MEACIDIFLKGSIAGYKDILVEEFYQMAGKEYEYDPPRYALFPGVYFELACPPKHIINRASSFIDLDDFTAIHLECGLIDRWELSVNKGLDEEIFDVKSKLISLLDESKEWVFFFELNCDQIDSIYFLSSLGLMEKIESNLDWESEPEGFVAVCATKRR